MTTVPSMTWRRGFWPPPASMSWRADSAGAGLSAARGIKPDAILVDVMLPDRDGVDLACDLAALPWRPRVLLTSVSDEIAGGAGVDRSGAVDFIPKDALGKAPLELILGT